jgi:hypothetical protein
MEDTGWDGEDDKEENVEQRWWRAAAGQLGVVLVLVPCRVIWYYFFVITIREIRQMRHIRHYK